MFEEGMIKAVRTWAGSGVHSQEGQFNFSELKRTDNGFSLGGIKGRGVGRRDQRRGRKDLEIQ